MSKDNEEPTDLDWIQLRRDMGQSHQIETFKEKFVRKFGENPFVPIGILLYLYAFLSIILSQTVYSMFYTLFCFAQFC